MSEYTERRDEDEENSKKFKIVDKRRINVDDIEASDRAPEPPKTPKADSPISENAPGEPVKETVREPGANEDEVEFKFAPGVGPDDPEPELVLDEDPFNFTNITLNIMQTLITVALVDLGLVPHPQTNLVVKRLEEARKIIDLCAHVLDKAGGELPEQIKVEFARALQDLKASYINQL